MHEKILLTKAISNKIAIARLYKSDTTGLDIRKFGACGNEDSV
jgi:hypothetical protein